MSSWNAPFSPSVRIFRGTKLLTMQVALSEVKRKSASEKAGFFGLCPRIPCRANRQSRLKSRAMPDILHPGGTKAVGPNDSRRLFDWPSQITSAERKSLLAGGFGGVLDAMDVMLYFLVLTYLIREFSMDTRTAGFLHCLTLGASASVGLVFRGGPRPHRS